MEGHVTCRVEAPRRQLWRKKSAGGAGERLENP